MNLVITATEDKYIFIKNKNKNNKLYIDFYVHESTIITV